MQASINAIRHRKSFLAWRFIRSNKMNIDFSYLKVDSMNRRCISNNGKPALPDTLKENKFLQVSYCSHLNFNKELKQCFPDAPDEMVALLDAVFAKNSSLVRNLIKFNKIDINYAFPPMENTVLHHAASRGYMDIVKILAEEGHASCCKNMFGFLPIHHAAQNDHMDLVQYFSDRSPETKALLEAVQQKNSSRVRSLIKSNKVDVNYAYPMEENTVLHVAASEGSLEIVKILVEEGQAESLTNGIEYNPIHLAAQNGHADVVRYLAGTGCSGASLVEMLLLDATFGNIPYDL